MSLRRRDPRKPIRRNNARRALERLEGELLILVSGSKGPQGLADQHRSRIYDLMEDLRAWYNI